MYPTAGLLDHALHVVAVRLEELDPPFCPYRARLDVVVDKLFAVRFHVRGPHHLVKDARGILPERVLRDLRVREKEQEDVQVWLDGSEQRERSRRGK